MRRYQANQTAYEVLVEVQSFRATPSTVTLQLVQDGEVVETQKLSLGAGERVQRLYPDLAGAGARLEARLADAHDALPLDDVAYAVLPRKHKQKVLLVTARRSVPRGRAAPRREPRRRQDRARGVRRRGDGEVRRRRPRRLHAGEPPRTHALYLDPHGAKSPFAIRGSVDGPLIDRDGGRRIRSCAGWRSRT